MQVRYQAAPRPDRWDAHNTRSPTKRGIAAMTRAAKQTSSTTRRRFLTASATGTAASLIAGSEALRAAQPSAPVGALSRERYLQYVAWFNDNDPRFLDFYHPDVVLELGNTTLKGANAIRDFYAEVKAHIRETVTVNHYVSDANGVAAVQRLAGTELLPPRTQGR
jgi:hypothetical protein